MNDKLKSCPFCGEETQLLSDVATFDVNKAEDVRVCFVVCQKCQTREPTAATPKDAIKAWNRRAGE